MRLLGGSLCVLPSFPPNTLWICWPTLAKFNEEEKFQRYKVLTSYVKTGRLCGEERLKFIVSALGMVGRF